MQTFHTPPGGAGWDQLHAMTESVQSELEQMFLQFAKYDVLHFGVGRVAHKAFGSDETMMLHAQGRECQAQATFHAGRALELAMHLVYARGADRILGREYPGVDKKLMDKDRESHSLERLFDRIVDDLSGRNMRDAFDEVYQESLHKGVVDLYLDDKLLWSFFPEDDLPLAERSMNSMIDGAEMTLDHANGFAPLGFFSGKESEFKKMPFGTFGEFLRKADAAYYESDVKGSRRNMRWTLYSARDHEYGRPYVVVGRKFFARLVGGVVGLSHQQWTWHPDFRDRWYQRRKYNIGKIVSVHLMQNYAQEAELPEMKSAEEMAKLYQLGHDGKSFLLPEQYKVFHRKWNLQSKGR